MTKRPAGQPIWTALSAVALLALLGVSLANIDVLIGVLEWVRGAGTTGVIVFVAAYLVGTLLMLPASLLQGSAGFLFGPIAGVVIASLGSVTCGSVCFGLSRTVLRGPVERRVDRIPNFGKIDRAIGNGGTYLVFLLRLSPISPFNILNYGLGLTRVRYSQFALGTWLGSIPAVTLYSYVGASVGSLTEIMDGSATRDPLLQGTVLLCTAVATLLVARFAQRALKSALDGA